MSLNASQIDSEALAKICDNLPVGVYRTTPSGDIIYANPSLANLFGYALDEFKRLNTTELYVNIDAREKLVRSGHAGSVDIAQALNRDRAGPAGLARRSGPDGRRFRNEGDVRPFLIHLCHPLSLAHATLGIRGRIPAPPPDGLPGSHGPDGHLRTGGLRKG
jgi:PAS domain-containing protein